MARWDELASAAAIQKTVKALEQNGIEVVVVENGGEAKKKALELIPAGAEVMTMSSVTLEAIGLAKEINESGKYGAVRLKLSQDKKLGSVPEWAVGSVQAVTEDGKLLMASNTGSQLAAYVYGSPHVIWVAGTQKIVADMEAGIERIYGYVLPLEDARARQAYGVGSNVSKLLIINKEVRPGRVRLILVKEKLGF
jgi:hypothetical protein